MNQNSDNSKKHMNENASHKIDQSLNKTFIQEKLRNSLRSEVDQINFISDIYIPKWLTIPLSKNLFINQTEENTQDVENIYFSGTKNLEAIMKRLNDLDIFKSIGISGKINADDKLQVDVLLQAKKQWETRVGLGVHDHDFGLEINGKARNLTGLLEVYNFDANISPFHTVRRVKAQASFPLMEYFKFCQPFVSFSARKETPLNEFVVQKVGVCIKDEIRKASLNIEHNFKGTRLIPKTANIDFDNLKHTEDYESNYNGLRVMIKKNIENSFSKNSNEQEINSNIMFGLNLGLHNANETFLETKYTQKRRIPMPSHNPYLNLFHTDLSIKIEGVQPILNTNANSIHHPRSNFGQYYWSSKYIEPQSSKDNFRISFQPKFKTNKLSFLGQQTRFQSYFYWNSIIGINTLDEKIHFNYEESAGIGLKYKLAEKFNINLGVQILKNRKINDAIFLNFTTD